MGAIQSDSWSLKSVVITCNRTTLDQCDCFNRFIDAMQKYDEHNRFNSEDQKIDTSIIDTLNISQILDDYLHLMQHHDEDKQFDFISSILSQCKISTCNGFKRNHFDRFNNINYINSSNSTLQILDKIHSYFCHSYDIGLRLTTKQLQNIENDIKNTSDDEQKKCFCLNKRLTNINQIMSHKRELCTFNHCKNRTHKLCNQLSSEQKNNNNSNLFHFGHAFNYGYKGEYGTSDLTQFLGIVKSKYKSLKQEVTSNNTVAMTIEQFNSEYKKAALHHNSRFCKNNYANFDQYEDKMLIKRWRFSIENILTLMVYCNYDALQFEFSKSYRMDKKDHNAFFHMGKNIKIAVQQFGIQIPAWSEKKFYHGLNKMFLFPKITQKAAGIAVSCPLSTTMSLPVTLNFAQEDFPAEKEYLFVQNDNSQRLVIKNIFDVTTCYEYHMVLEALNYLNSITQPYLFSVPDPWKLELVINIIHHQLSLNNSSFQSFECLAEYGKQLINVYFQSKILDFTVNYGAMKKCKENIIGLFDVFCQPSYDWIQLHNIKQLFTNLTKIRITGLSLNESMFEDMLVNVKNLKIKEIVIENYGFIGKQPSWAVNQYVQQFDAIGYGIQDGNHDKHNQFLRIATYDVLSYKPTTKEILMASMNVE
eukprot:398636_1